MSQDSSIKISSVDIFKFNIPMKFPFKISLGTTYEAANENTKIMIYYRNDRGGKSIMENNNLNQTLPRELHGSRLVGYSFGMFGIFLSMILTESYINTLFYMVTRFFYQ